MNKQRENILQHYEVSIKFVESLSALIEDQWRSQIAEGKWTIAEVIGHLGPWDEFVLNKRIPYLFSKADLPKGPDAKEMNAESAIRARQQSKEITINQFIEVRTALYETMKQIPETRWEEEIHIGKSTLTLSDYFLGLAEHDQHHFNQILSLRG
ncbi:DinB family protein [Cytobacillus purgationiresistens]|uniref:DinB-like domain-containing protein n=1 Tax=Cytobacillus purgationiresistens TaxID=863449 RepID=A0ABU0APF4_9BACI|nr:DinB family protein [Cytobacillus purgationiresistens]MDQ0272910.1 hypothetical protein [Cytobacillus purgationiresistens]